MKVYQVIMQDEYNNLYLLGFYKALKDALKDVNDWLSMYQISIEEIEEYASTFSSCFDKELEVDEGVVYIRGFVFDVEDLKEVLSND